MIKFKNMIGKNKTISILKYVFVSILMGISTTAGYHYFSPEQKADRWYRAVNKDFMKAHKNACKYGEFSAKHNVGDSFMKEHCGYLSEEERNAIGIVAWGGDFLEKFNN